MKLHILILILTTSLSAQTSTVDTAILAALHTSGAYTPIAAAVTANSGMTITSWTCIQISPAATPWKANFNWSMNQLVLSTTGDVYKVTKMIGSGGHATVSGAEPPVWNRMAPVIDGEFQLTYLYSGGWQFFCSQ
jgi:hypothetical protein